MNSLRKLFSIVRFNTYLMNQQFLVNFLKQKINTEVSFLCFQISTGILTIILCPLMTDCKIFCLVFSKKVFKYGFGYILFIEILLIEQKKFNCRIHVL